MNQEKTANSASPKKRAVWPSLVKKDFRQNWGLYIMILPVLAFYIIFCYVPMYGAIIAFKNYSTRLGILASPWAEPFYKHFQTFFTMPYFKRLMVNTLTISINTLIWGFPAPILLALLINELKNKTFTKITQTITYLPYFISMVVICGMIKTFTNSDGFINDIIALFGGERVTMLSKPSYFVPVYVISDIWQSVGWGSIIYLSALAGIDQGLYEAARIDGAGRWRQTWHITIPGILPTIIILLILRVGGLLNVGYEKIILLYNPATYQKADVISSYVYRYGLGGDGGANPWSFSTAVGLFNSVINFVLIIITNKISRAVSDTSLW